MKKYILLISILVFPGVLLAQRVLKTFPGGINLVTDDPNPQPYMTRQISLPTVYTTVPTNIAFSTADCGGIVANDGDGAVTARGVCWSLVSPPTIADPRTTNGAGTGVFASVISGIDLIANPVYYVRAYATNSFGTGYGNEIAFTGPPNCGLVTDGSGNNYSTLIVNNKCWTRENLYTTKYNDGSNIPLVIVGATWAGLGTDAYCWYSNNEAGYKIPFGALYNWYAVNTAKLCPTGWHVSTKNEWDSMTGFLGGSTAATFLKESGTVHWRAGNVATNSTSFTALPVGNRSNTGTFSPLGTIKEVGTYWTATDAGGSTAFFAQFFYNGTNVTVITGDYLYGNAVRCVRD